MTEEEARARLEVLMRSTEDLAPLGVQRLRRVYLEIPEGDPGAPVPVRVRDARVWLAELWAGVRGARVVIDDRSGDVLQVERR